MINWLLFYRVYLAGGIALIVIHQFCKVLPPRTSRGWIVLLLAIISLLIGAWLYLEPHLYFEFYSVNQWVQLGIAALLQQGTSYVIYERLLKE
jgi:hypothetical protein